MHLEIDRNYRKYALKRKFIFFVLALWFPLAGHAGTAAGFCPGATPPSPDPLEPNESLAQNTPIRLSVAVGPGLDTNGKVRLNFDSDLDEEWLSIPLLAGTPYNVVFNNFGPGMPWDFGVTGPGFFYEIFNEDGSMMVQAGDSFDCSETSVSDRPFVPPIDGVYQIRIVQCRNEFPVAVMSCIPDDPSVDFEMASAAGLAAGVLTGVITDLSTGLPLVLSVVQSGVKVGFTSPAYGGLANGAYSFDVTEGAALTAIVTSEGYQPQSVQFDIEAGKPTSCSVALMPTGKSANKGAEIPIFANGFEEPQVSGPVVSGACIAL